MYLKGPKFTRQPMNFLITQAHTERGFIYKFHENGNFPQLHFFFISSANGATANKACRKARVSIEYRSTRTCTSIL